MLQREPKALLHKLTGQVVNILVKDDQKRKEIVEILNRFNIPQEQGGKKGASIYIVDQNIQKEYIQMFTQLGKMVLDSDYFLENFQNFEDDQDEFENLIQDMNQLVYSQVQHLDHQEVQENYVLIKSDKEEKQEDVKKFIELSNNQIFITTTYLLAQCQGYVVQPVYAKEMDWQQQILIFHSSIKKDKLIISYDWIQDSLKQGKIIDKKKYCYYYSWSEIQIQSFKIHRPVQKIHDDDQFFYDMLAISLEHLCWCQISDLDHQNIPDFLIYKRKLPEQNKYSKENDETQPKKNNFVSVKFLLDQLLQKKFKMGTHLPTQEQIKSQKEETASKGSLIIVSQEDKSQVSRSSMKQQQK